MRRFRFRASVAVPVLALVLAAASGVVAATQPVLYPGLVVFRGEGRTVLGRGRFEPRLRDDLSPGELVRQLALFSLSGLVGITR